MYAYICQIQCSTSTTLLASKLSFKSPDPSKIDSPCAWQTDVCKTTSAYSVCIKLSTARKAVSCKVLSFVQEQQQRYK